MAGTLRIMPEAEAEEQNLEAEDTKSKATITGIKL
jgi:hypothetical protein